MLPKDLTLPAIIALAQSDEATILDFITRNPKATVIGLKTIVSAFLEMQDRIQAAEGKVTSLERNSRTSSKPPSSDRGNFTNPPKPKSQRKKSERKTGGQPGHPGTTLAASENPDYIIEHRLAPDTPCPGCGEPISCASTDSPLGDHSYLARQVHDLPPPPKLEVTEHRVELAHCPHCTSSVSAAFPESVKAPVQYGPRVQATALYLGCFQLLPYKRLTECLRELFNCPLSEGTLANIIKQADQKARQTLEPIRQALLESPVAHADETSCRVNRKRYWWHVFSNDQLTIYYLDPSRGVDGIKRAGMIPNYQGILMHDFLAAYRTFTNCVHGFCNAHLQRELTYLAEEMDQKWASQMIEVLLEAKELAEKERSRPPESPVIIDEETIQRIWRKFADIVLEGYAMNPPPPNPPEGKRGRVKRGKVLNLLDRLDRYGGEIMRYFEDLIVPYDNNQAERDLRMMKVKEKISGQFRNYEYGQAFSSIRSVISTVRKQSGDMITRITLMVEDPQTLGQQLARAGRPE